MATDAAKHAKEALSSSFFSVLKSMDPKGDDLRTKFYHVHFAVKTNIVAVNAMKDTISLGHNYRHVMIDSHKCIKSHSVDEYDVPFVNRLIKQQTYLDGIASSLLRAAELTSSALDLLPDFKRDACRSDPEFKVTEICVYNLVDSLICLSKAIAYMDGIAVPVTRRDSRCVDLISKATTSCCFATVAAFIGLKAFKVMKRKVVSDYGKTNLLPIVNQINSNLSNAAKVMMVLIEDDCPYESLPVCPRARVTCPPDCRCEACIATFSEVESNPDVDVDDETNEELDDEVERK